MDEFPGLLARDFGIRRQGKSAPMSASKPSSTIGSGSTTARSGSATPLSFDDVFAAPSKHTNPNPNPASSSSSPLDSIFGGFSDPNPNSNSAPVYDDDIFDGVPGLKSSAKVVHDDVFSPVGRHVDESGTYDDLLGGLGMSSSSRGESRRSEEDSGGFEELIPGFGGSSPPRRREPPEANQQKSAGPSANPTSTMPENPFVVLETNSSGVFTDPLEHLGRPMNSKGVNIDASPPTGGIFENVDSFDGINKSVPEFTSNKKNENRKERSPMETFENVIPKTRPTKSFDSRSSVQSPKSNDSPYADQSPKSSEHLDAAEEVWLTVSEIPLFTQPTRAPPPSRRPPPLVIKSAPVGRTGSRKKDNESYSRSGQSHSRSRSSATRPSASSIDELEDFAMGKPQPNERADIFSSEEDIETNSAAAAMKEAMDKAEAKFKHAKEVRERERDARSSRSREFPQQERDFDDMEDKERQEKLEREEREREQRRRERERAELEREKARQAVERATREARERAAADARAKAERAAVEKVNAEARQCAERAAVQRAAAEARERAAAEAQERAERSAAEARERAASEARIRAERVAADRAYAEARERAASAAREKQHKAENDLESFFGMGTRANSAPKQRATTSENVFDTQAQSRGSADGPRWSSSNSPSTIRKASSATNIVDDLSSIFGGAPSSGEFKEVEGETEERRRARLERHQRTLERAAKVLAEKNERDMQTQRDQAERHRIAETMDFEIKRWAAGKEGNLRALLSTLQYVDLITAVAVKKVYRKATLCIHPDKVQQKGANLQQKYIAEKVFDLLKEAWNKFNSEELF